jgi:uncharacterized membrane protein YkoI
MNTAPLRRKRVVLPALATAVVLGIGGTVWSATASDHLQAGERDRAGRAAVAAVGGTVVEVEKSDDRGEAYEVEVRTEDGPEVEVALDQDLAVVSQDADDRDDDGQDDQDDDGDDTRDRGDRVLSASERGSVARAARAAVPGGTVLEVEAGDDRGEAYEAAVRDADGTEWDLVLDAELQVVGKTADD